LHYTARGRQQVIVRKLRAPVTNSGSLRSVRTPVQREGRTFNNLIDVRIAFTVGPATIVTRRVHAYMVAASAFSLQLALTASL
jgi:hypothetical protein